MAISASLVKELRQRTGSGMMECKKALVETNGDLEQALDLMRKSGAAKAAKKAGRIAAEGLVNIAMSADKKEAAIIEVNSETDFVSKSDDFINFVNELSQLALEIKTDDIDKFNNSNMTSGTTVENARKNLIAKIGENISVRRVSYIDAGSDNIGSYKHGDKIAVLAVLSESNESLAKDVAMHIAASRPECIDESQVPKDLLAKEKQIFVEQAKESGKPENIIEKMVAGRVRKFISEITLYGQAFIKNPDTTVGKLVKENNADVISFIRFEVGEGIEKKADDFVKEVMEQAKS